MFKTNNKLLFTLLSALFVLFVGGVLLLSNFDKKADAATKPNFVLILTDDQTLESMRTMQRTKTLLAQEGTTLGNQITSYSICCPSRATLLTGQYDHNTGVRDNSQPNGAYPNFKNTKILLPSLLKDAGYATTHIGKYMNGYGVGGDLTTANGWTDWQTYISPNRYFNHKIDKNGVLSKYGSSSADYSTDVYANIAKNKIQKYSSEGKPFFIQLSINAPHSEKLPNGKEGPPIPAPRHQSMFTNESLPNKPSNNEADVSDKPAHIQNRSITNTMNSGVTITEAYRQQLRSLQAVDEAVAGIVQKLADVNQLNNTYIIYTSDNGYYNSEHRISSGKYYPYEESIHAPFIIRGPGITKNATANGLTSNIDIAPTILDLAKVNSTYQMDGRSFKSLLQAPSTPRTRPVLLSGYSSNTGYPRYNGIRTDRYTYVEWDTGERELYDLQTDPYQLQSQHGNPAFAAIKSALSAKISILRSCKGRSCDDAPYGFSDVTETMPKIDAIIWTAKNNISNWYDNNLFKPDELMTRGDMVSWLYRMSGSPASNIPNGYIDVPATNPNYQAVNWAKAQGIASGFTDNTFRPNDPIKRNQMAEWLWKLNGSPTDSPQRSYSDVPQNSQYYPSINWIVARNIADGFTGNAFNPNEAMPRKRAALWVWNSKGHPKP